MIGSQNHTLTELEPSPDLTCATTSLIYDWFHVHFPAWRPESDPRFPRSSQSLLPAFIPGDTGGPVGMVHFKSILDPLWSADDLASFKNEIAWVLLILSPFERFYELDPLLEELSLASPRLVIWRPDRPAAEESARLRVSSLVSPVVLNDSAKSNGALKEADDAGEILTAVYQQRGSLIEQGVRHAISEEIGSLTLQEYLAACIRSAATTASRPKPVHPQESEQTVLRWAALLSGSRRVPFRNLTEAEAEILSWADAHLYRDFGLLGGGSQPLPEPFLTTRFRNEAAAFDSALELMRQTVQCLYRGDVAFPAAMAQVIQTFGCDEERLLHWQSLAEEVPDFLRWLPEFGNAFDYLNRSFPVPDGPLAELKQALLSACAEPHRFLQSGARKQFNIEYDQYKVQYIEYYDAAHASTVQVLKHPERMKARVDPIALRNLELLSELHLGKRSYLHRARALGKAVQAGQCDLPVREILNRQPRCYCNFHPEHKGAVLWSLDQIGATVRAGLDYFRSLLREHANAIARELKNPAVNSGAGDEINSLLGDGPMIPLKPQTVAMLNAILPKAAR
jgi:hypothetical protein